MKFGDYVVPLTIALILIFGAFHRTPLFDSFTDGAREGVRTAFKILPTLAGMLTAIAMFKASGMLDMLSLAVKPVADAVGLPAEVVPLALLRPVSGSGGIALLQNVFDTCGADSYAGRVASVIAGATETTFYTIAVYYGAVGIKKTRYTVPAAMGADIAGIFASVLAVRLILGA